MAYGKTLLPVIDALKLWAIRLLKIAASHPNDEIIEYDSGKIRDVTFFLLLPFNDENPLPL
jgi:hypothetical protein